MPDVSCIIPARLEATRFPRKLLQPLNGKPVLRYTARRALEAGCFREVWVLGDAPELLEAVAGLACKTLMTGPAANGTERIAKNLDALSGDLFVNLQGDEPGMPPELLQRVARGLEEEPQSVHLGGCREISNEQWQDPNRVKVLCDGGVDGDFRDGNARVLEFVRDSANSRVREPANNRARITGPSPLNRPIRRTGSAFRTNKQVALQFGVYGYNRKFLESYRETPPSAREKELSHEMLRLIPLPPMRVHFSEMPPHPVDSPEDLARLQVLPEFAT